MELKVFYFIFRKKESERLHGKFIVCLSCFVGLVVVAGHLGIAMLEN